MWAGRYPVLWWHQLTSFCCCCWSLPALPCRAGSPLSLKANQGYTIFNKWFTDVKKAVAKYEAANGDCKPCPDWVKTVAVAAVGTASEVEDLTDEEAYDFIEKHLPKGAKVCACVCGWRQGSGTVRLWAGVVILVCPQNSQEGRGVALSGFELGC